MLQENLAANTPVSNRPEKNWAQMQNRIYHRVEQEILKSRNYTLNDEALRIIAAAAAQSRQSEAVTTMAILEQFNEEQGALLGELGQEYVRLAYAPEMIEKWLAENNGSECTPQSFHEAVAGISAAIRQKKIFLDKELINRAATEAEEVMGVVEMN